MGSVTFTATSGGVSVAITINGCVNGKSYPIHIHEGSSCADTAMQGPHWDIPRGEGIPNVVCMGTTGMVSYTRLSSDAKPWTIGDPAASNVVGHVMVLHDPDDTTKRIACGKIAAQ
jgi:Cu/Zn superoxide dismutase